MILTSVCSVYAVQPWSGQTEAFSSLVEGTGLKVYKLEKSDSVLTSGIFYVAENMSFEGQDAASNKEPGGDGLRIAPDSTVYIYIPEGVTLTAKGGAGCKSEDVHQEEMRVGLVTNVCEHAGIRYVSFERENGKHQLLGVSGVHTNTVATGGGAGIFVPSSSKLVVFGEGTIEAAGGKGGDAGKGADGLDTRVFVGSWSVLKGHSVKNERNARDSSFGKLVR